MHGGAAHAHWWSFLAPLLADRWHSVALDLSGHGDSGRRESYSLEAWAEEVMAVAERAAFPSPPVVVGHSMGGLVAAQAALDFGESLAGAVLVDAPLKRPDPESQEGSRRPALRPPSVYPTREEAVARFRLMPAQPVSHRFLLEHVAAHSVREVPGGWTWKFDPFVFRRQRLPVGERLPGPGAAWASSTGSTAPSSLRNRGLHRRDDGPGGTGGPDCRSPPPRAARPAPRVPGRRCGRCSSPGGRPTAEAE